MPSMPMQAAEPQTEVEEVVVAQAAVGEAQEAARVPRVSAAVVRADAVVAVAAASKASRSKPCSRAKATSPKRRRWN